MDVPRVIYIMKPIMRVGRTKPVDMYVDVGTLIVISHSVTTFMQLAGFKGTGADDFTRACDHHI